MSYRGQTAVLGNILLIAIVIVLAVTLTTLSFAFLENTGTPTADAAFEYEQSQAGLEVVPKALGTDVSIQLNGQEIETLSADSAGETVLVPTAPDDTVTIVSEDEDRSVLVNKEIDDRSEVGDLIAYYTFESGSGTTLEDRSGNGNDGTLDGDSNNWVDSGYDFTGSDHFAVQNLTTPVDEVSEFTIAVAYETDTGDEKQELTEHISGSDNWGIEIKQCGPNWDACTPSDSNKYNPNFFADEAGGSQSGEIFGGTQDTGQRQVIVGTYNGSSTEIYVDGNSKGTNSFSSEISMGDFYIGTDAENPGNRDHLDGRIYEVRLYYKAFSDEQVRTLTDAMSP